MHGNHLGVPIVTTNASGQEVSPGSDFLRPGFPGQSQVLSDLYYNRNRDYDPVTGRYIQADPIGLAGDVNPYVYARSDPVNGMDPLGLRSKWRDLADWVPVLGSGLDAYDAYTCGDYGWALVHTGLALSDLTGFGGFAKVGAKQGAGWYLRHGVVGSDTVVSKNGWRTRDGRFASPLGPGRPGGDAEVAVWDAIAKKPGWRVDRGAVGVRDASGQLRYYDGVAISPRGRVIGLEVKSGSASRTAAQTSFDRTLNSNPSNVATGVGQSSGTTVQRSILIRTKR